MLIITSQMRDLVGIRKPDIVGETFLEKVYILLVQIAHFDFVNLAQPVLGLCQLSMLFGLKRLKKSKWLKDFGNESVEDKEFDVIGEHLAASADMPPIAR